MDSKGDGVAYNSFVDHLLAMNKESGVWGEVALGRRPRAFEARLNCASRRAAVVVYCVVIITALLSTDKDAIST